MDLVFTVGQYTQVSHLESARETLAMISAEGRSAAAYQADVSRDVDCAALIVEAKSTWGQINILVNNVGIGGGGDGPAHRAGLGSHSDRQSQIRLDDHQARLAHHARSAGVIVNISR